MLSRRRGDARDGDYGFFRRARFGFDSTRRGDQSCARGRARRASRTRIERASRAGRARAVAARAIGRDGRARATARRCEGAAARQLWDADARAREATRARARRRSG